MTIGVLTGLFGVGWSLYTEYIKRGEVTVAIVSEGTVLDVRRDLPDLVVLFGSQDLRAAGKSLSFYSLSVRNSGSLNITKNMFDDQIGWGIELKGAEFIRLSDFTASNSLLKVVDPEAAQPDKVKFKAAIFDSGDAFKFDVLVVHSKTQQPAFSLIGGISGTNFLLLPSAGNVEDSGWEQVFSGSFKVHARRVVVYGIAFILVLIFFIASFATIAGAVDSFRRRAWAKKHLPSIIAKHGLDETAAKVLWAAHKNSNSTLQSVARAIRAEERKRKAPPPNSDTVEGRQLMELKALRDSHLGGGIPLDYVKASLASLKIDWDSFLALQTPKDLVKLRRAIAEVISTSGANPGRNVDEGNVSQP